MSAWAWLAIVASWVLVFAAGMVWGVLSAVPAWIYDFQEDDE
jgi:hypothetical protein